MTPEMTNRIHIIFFFWKHLELLWNMFVLCRLWNVVIITYQFGYSVSNLSRNLFWERCYYINIVYIYNTVVINISRIYSETLWKSHMNQSRELLINN